MFCLAFSFVAFLGATEPVPTPSAYGSLPLHFEENIGQADCAAKFVAKGPGHALFLMPDETLLLLRNATENACFGLRMKYMNANADITVSGENPLPGKSNYFIGNSEDHWYNGAAHFACVRHKALYPGIDLLFYGQSQQLEYDFVLAPGANPNDIQLAFQWEGTQTGDPLSAIPSLNPDGALLFSAPDGEIRLNAPIAYQVLNGMRKIVPVTFAIHPNGNIGFVVSDYDSSRPLTIDPVLVYGTYLGGNALDHAYDIVVDSAGNSYLTGDTLSTDFPVSSNAIQSQFGGGSGVGDVFIAKLNPSGSSLVFCTYLGGADNDGGVGIAIDDLRNIYVTGGSNSTDFPTTSGAYRTVKANGRDAFIVKLNPDGDTLAYSSFLGGAYDDCGVDIATDANGIAWITGWTYSNDLPMSPGAIQGRFGGGNHDTFIAALTPNGNGLAYGSYFGGSGQEDGRSIALDDTGNIYFTGYTSSQDLITTASAFQQTYQGGTFDAFAAKINVSAQTLAYSTYLGGSNEDSGRGIAVDSAGNAYLTGDTNSWNFPTTTASFQEEFAGGDRDAFVLKLLPDGNGIVYGTFLGGTSTDYGYAIATDSIGNAYTTGYTYSSNFPVIAGTLQPAYGGSQDAFVSKINRFGNRLSFSTYLGGTLWEKGNGIGLDDANNLYVAGSTGSNDFPTTSGAVQPLASGGNSSAFVVRIAADNDTEGSNDGAVDGEEPIEGQQEGDGLRLSLVGLASRTVTVGASVTFIVSISGHTGTVNYTWMFKPADGLEYGLISAPNSPILTLKNLQTDDSGRYRCMATDSSGSATSPSFILTVIGPEGEGSIDGEGTAEGEDITEGLPDGAIEGNPEGAPEGEGQTEGEGTADGEGLAEGEGTADGEGLAEGEGTTDGEGLAEGEGTTDGEGQPEGEGTADGEGSFDGENPCGISVDSGDLSIPLMDQGLTIATLPVNSAGVVSKITVQLDIQHPAVNQLLAQLVSPQGTEVFLFLYPAQGGVNITNVLFDDDADISINDAIPPLTGIFRPVMPLSLLEGAEIHGNWTLRLIDGQLGSTGYLMGWAININPCPTEGQGSEGADGEGEGLAPDGVHTADRNADWSINLTELLRVIQFFNFRAYHCMPDTEDGYAPGLGDQSCVRHDSDYMDTPWVVSLSELLRLIQFFNLRAYHRCDIGEDGFCPGI